jgi:hypothetical protein
VRFVAVVVAGSFAFGAGCGREHRSTHERIRNELGALEKERDELRRKLDDLVSRDPRLAGMPLTPLRVALPTTLVRELIERLVAGFVDQVTLELHDLKLEKSGTVKKIVTLGTYQLDVNVDKLSARLKTSKPDVRFGGDKVTLALAVTVASGSGQASIHFRWDGKNVSGAACGDLDIQQVVTGKVKPNRYRVQGTLLLTATAEKILATPRFPQIKIKLEIDPSPESWAAVQEILDSRKTGVCGFALERIDVLKIVRGIVEKGFEVRLPTEKIKPLTVPVGIEPTMNVRGKPVALAIRLGGLAITPHALWLGGHVALQPQDEPATVAGAKASAHR